MHLDSPKETQIIQIYEYTLLFSKKLLLGPYAMACNITNSKGVDFKCMYENEIQDEDMLISNLTFSPRYFIIRTTSPLPVPIGIPKSSIAMLNTNTNRIIRMCLNAEYYLFKWENGACFPNSLN